MKKKIGLLTILLGLAVLSAALIIWQFRAQPLQSPISSQTVFRFLGAQQQPSGATTPKVVYGFLPYWNIGKVTIQPELTHLSYFSLGIGAHGEILSTEPGFQKYTSEELLALVNKARSNGTKIEIVFSEFNNDDIAAFLTNQKSRQNFLHSLDSALLSYPINGVNIDIEYSGIMTAGIQNGMTQFMSELHDHLQSNYKAIGLSIDVYSSAASLNQIWDLNKISQYVDYVIVMAYDFHRRSSIVAGPVAPLFGGRKFWDNDITIYLKDLIEKVPKSKILLGIPFYGYEWQTTTRDAQAQTYPDTGATATIERVQELLSKKQELQVEEHWNDEALSPYLSYKKNGDIFVIYYENSRSLSYKLDLVNQLELGGIAIWALGYERDSRELWDVIHHKVSLQQ